jgi:hypothetical protein
MLTRPTTEQLLAMSRIAALPDWKIVETALNNELAKAIEHLLESHDDVVLRVSQGQAKALRGFRDSMRCAQATLEKLKK